MRTKLRTTRRRGQMFILATMLIAVYIVTMSATILNISTNQIAITETSIREPYSNIKRELQSFLELLLASYTDNSSTINSSYAESELQEFLTILEAVDSARSILSNINLVSNSFFIEANMSPSSNVQVGSIYTSTIQARFHLELSDLISSFNLIEDFNLSFSGQVEVNGNTLVVRQSRGSITEYVDATNVFIMNNSVPIIPNQYLNKTGYYFFEGININNIGVMSVTLPNGVQIFS